MSIKVEPGEFVAVVGMLNARYTCSGNSTRIIWMRVGHAPERQLIVGAGQDCRRQDERAADDEVYGASAINGLVFHMRGEMPARPAFAVDSERDDVRAVAPIALQCQLRKKYGYRAS